MTGGSNAGFHVTDPTNASRTMLMNSTRSTFWKRGNRGGDDHPAVDAPEIGRRRGLRQGPHRRPRARCADRRHPRRPAGLRRSGRPASRSATRETPTAPATSCPQHGTTPIPSKDGLLTTCAPRSGNPGDPCTPSKARSRSPARSCRAARQPRDEFRPRPRLSKARRDVDATRRLLRTGLLGPVAPYWRADARAHWWA